MKKYFVGVLCASILALAVVAPVAKAQTAVANPTIASLLLILQGLKIQVEELQKSLVTPRSEVQAVQGEIKAGLREGMTDIDIRKIQELLASDPTLYPRGLVTGYYGPLTSEGIKQFQVRNGLAVTGMIDEVTRVYLEEYYLEYKANRGAATLWSLSNREVIKMRIEARQQAGSLSPTTPSADAVQPTTASQATAEEAISEAATAIANLEDELEQTEASFVDINLARADRAKAQNNLNQAERYLSARQYSLAYDSAMKAYMDASVALDVLTRIEEEFFYDDEFYDDEFDEEVYDEDDGWYEFEDN